MLTTTCRQISRWTTFESNANSLPPSDSDLFSLMSGSPDALARLLTHPSPSTASQKSSTSARKDQAIYMPRLPKELRVSYEEPAIQFYYDTMVKSPSATQFVNQHLSMWSTLYTQASADSPVRQAAYALSLAVCMNI
jgi:hypothetical protein